MSASPSRSTLRRWWILSAALLLPPVAAGVSRGQGMPPTKEHEAMHRDAGVWDADCTFWMTPGGEPVHSKGVETIRSLGKLWLVGDFEGEMGGAKFTGHSQTGYDPAKKKYVGTWIDTMSPFMNTMEGDYDVAKHTLTMNMTGVDPGTGKTVTSTAVTHYVDEDTKTFEIQGPDPSDETKTFKMMEIKYKRRK
jgi:hypothetical protein